jgi:hypothetical protein
MFVLSPIAVSVKMRDNTNMDCTIAVSVKMGDNTNMDCTIAVSVKRRSSGRRLGSH